MMMRMRMIEKISRIFLHRRHGRHRIIVPKLRMMVMMLKVSTMKLTMMKVSMMRVKMVRIKKVKVASRKPWKDGD